jgi:drug/metabolite transporter (DMT)-like permease
MAAVNSTGDPGTGSDAAAAALRRGFLMLLLVVVIWGVSWPVNKVILQTVTPLWMTALRSVIATVALVAICAATGRLRLPPRGDLPIVWSIALLHMVGFATCANIGLHLVPAGRSVLLGYTTTLWVVPGAVFFLGERLTPRRAAGVAVGLAGLIVLFNPAAFDVHDPDAVLGNGIILVGAMLWAANIVHIRAHRWRSGPLDLVLWQTIIAAVVLVAIAWSVDGPPPVRWAPRTAAFMAYTGVLGSAVAYWAVAGASRDLPAVTAALGLLGVPVVSIVVSTIWLDEPLTVTLVAGVLLILGGVAIGTARPRRIADPGPAAAATDRRA